MTNRGTVTGDFTTVFEIRSTIGQAGRTASGVIRGEYKGACPRGFVPGDLVINLQRENWTQKRRVDAADVIAVPAALDLRQAAMLRINPPTALLLLTDIVALACEADIEPRQRTAPRRIAAALAGRTTRCRSGVSLARRQSPR
jgi:hypothetical protein